MAKCLLSHCTVMWWGLRGRKACSHFVIWVHGAKNHSKAHCCAIINTLYKCRATAENELLWHWSSWIRWQWVESTCDYQLIKLRWTFGDAHPSRSVWPVRKGVISCREDETSRSGGPPAPQELQILFHLLVCSAVKAYLAEIFGTELMYFVTCYSQPDSKLI